MKTAILRALAVVLLVVVLLFTFLVSAEPDGANVITRTENITKNKTSPGVSTSDKGSVTIMVLSAVQQNNKWKAYVGNVTGTLVLKDADSYSIYEWPALGAPEGEVYITRNATIDWSTMGCANDTAIGNEQSALGHSAGASDNINNTFSNTIHQQFVTGITSITNSTCRSLLTFVNDNPQAPSESADFQEILLMDDSLRVVYTTIISQDANSYKNDGTTTYDFQAVVPDYAGSGISTYYFYVEIEG